MGLVNLAISATLMELAPGPVISVVLCRTLAGQTATAVAFLAGVTCGDLIAFGLVVSGLSLSLTSQGAGPLLVLKAAGTAYLLLVAAQMIWLARTSAAATQGIVDLRLAMAALAGGVTTLSNPFTYLLFLTVLPATMGLDRAAPVPFLPILWVLLVIRVGVCGAYIMLASTVGRMLADLGLQRRVSRILGWMLVATTVWVVVG